MPNGTRPKVSVFMITYNHEKFIAQAIDSILMQKVNFEYNIVVGEDCSTDNTRNILLQYQCKYPERFKLILHKNNVGAMQNQIITHENCNGEYIAILEGDDYWIDEYKLQKQVDFLEANREYSICFTDAKVVKENDFTNPNVSIEHAVVNNSKRSLASTDLLGWAENAPSCTLHLKDLVTGNKVITVTSMFRKNFDKLPDWFKECVIGDWPLHVINANYGNIWYMNDVTAVYRVHNNGVHSLIGFKKQLETTLLASKVIYNHAVSGKYKPLKNRTNRYLLSQLMMANYREGNFRDYTKYLSKYILNASPWREPRFILQNLKLLFGIMAKKIGFR